VSQSYLKSYDIPETWCWTKIGNLLAVIRGASPRPKGDPRFFGGEIPWIMISDVTKSKGKFISRTRDTVTEEGSKRSRYLKKGTLILSNSGSVCIPKILAVDGCIHDGFVAFPERIENLEKLYFYYYFEYIRPLIINANRQGVTQVNLNTTIVKDIDIPLPPHPEQQRIVAKIEELLTKLDAGLEALKHVQLQLKRYRQSVLKAAMEGKLTAKWRERHTEKLESGDKLLKRIQDGRETKLGKGRKETIPLDTSDLYELPEGWSWSNFERVAEIALNLVDVKSKQEYYHIAPNHIEKGAGKLLPFKTVKEDKVKSPKHHFFPGQILYSKIRPYLSKVVVVDFEGVCSADMYPINAFINTKYLFYWMLSANFIYHASKHQGRSVLPKINKHALASLPVPVPPLIEQRKSVSELERHFSISAESEQIIEYELKRAQSLRQSILKCAFEGKLVPQDPNDEPVSIPPEKIKSEITAPKKSKQLEMF